MKMYITYSEDSEQAKNFSVIEGKDEDECRNIARALTGNSYELLWPEVIFPSIQSKFGLTETSPQRATSMEPRFFSRKQTSEE